MKKLTKRQSQILAMFVLKSGLEADEYTIDSIEYSQKRHSWDVWYVGSHYGLLNYMVTNDNGWTWR